MICSSFDMYPHVVILAHLVLESEGFGRFRIRGSKSRDYICLNRKGNVVGLVSPTTSLLSS